MKNFVIGLFFLLGIGGCYYDVEEDLYGTTECSTDDMSYQTDIFPIINNNCLVCHSAASNFGGITLESYDFLKSYVNNGQLIGVINHESGFSPMPKNLSLIHI